MTCPSALHGKVQHASSIAHRNRKPPATQPGVPAEGFARDPSFFEDVSLSALAAAERQVVSLPTKE